MVKHSYEDTYPWQESHKWGLSASAEVVRWATKTYDEGLVECKEDTANLRDFNGTLKKLRQTLQQGDEEEASTSGASKTSRNKVPADQYEEIRQAGEAIAMKCRIWLGSARQAAKGAS